MHSIALELLRNEAGSFLVLGCVCVVEYCKLCVFFRHIPHLCIWVAR